MKRTLIALTALGMLGTSLSCGAGATQEIATAAASASVSSTASAKASGPAEPRRLAVGSFLACVINESDQLACWGPGFGRSPVVVSGADPVLALAVGRDVCAITKAGKITCWSSAATPRPGPAFEGGSLPVRIAVGDFAKCALLADGTVACWDGLSTPGLAHRFAMEAEAVDPKHRDSAPAEAHRVPGVEQVVQIEVDQADICALRADGAILCWTDQASGSEPVRVPLPPAGEIGFAGHRLCAVAKDGALSCLNGSEVLPVEGIRKARQLCSQGSRDKAYALDETGTLYEWGTGGTIFTATKAFEEDRHFAEIGAGFGHQCAILRSRAVACWGESAGGRLGLGATDDRGSPTVIPDLVARRPTDDKGAPESFEDLTFRSGKLAWTIKDAGPMDWDAARRHCAGLSLGGGGFRLPTRQELLDLYRDDSWRRSLGKGMYWSSSPVPGISAQAWNVELGDGFSFPYETTRSILVRCVR